MSLEDRIFMDYSEAAETFLRMDFEFITTTNLVRNDLQVILNPVGNVWFSSVERLECKQVQNKPQNHVHVDNVDEESIQKVDRL